jgi:hypothetical protein
MVATISWRGGDGANEIVPAESGANDTLGFFGANFGYSIRVGEYNQTSFVTTDNGSANHGQVPNLKYANVSGAYVASELTASELLEVNNDEATLQIRLVNDTPVQTRNTSFRAFDRSNVNNNPSGVAIYAAEILKGSVSVRGSGDTNWTQIYGSGSTLTLEDHLYGSGTHYWYVGLTATPQSIGQKTQIGFYFETEFL